MRRFLFVGCGNMGGAIASAAMRAIPDARITVVDPSPERAKALLPAGMAVEIHPDFAKLGEARFDLGILCVKPQQFAELSPLAISVIRSGAIASIMAGVTLDALAARLGSERIARTMPNLPALVGQAMTVGVAADGLTQADRRMVATLFEAVGQFRWLSDETLIDAATAVAGSGPGYIFAFAQYMMEAAVASGMDAALADLLVRQTFRGAAELLQADPRTAEELKKAVTSKAGTTEAGLAVFEAEGALPELCLKAVASAAQRARELSRTAAPESPRQ